MDKKVILLNHNKHMLKDLTDQINFQRPVKRLRTDVSKFLFNSNYTRTSTTSSIKNTVNQGTSSTSSTTSTVHPFTKELLQNFEDYDEDDSHWLTLLTHSTTHSDNYYYTVLRIKNTSK